MTLPMLIFSSIILILIEGFFSGSEIALVSSDKLLLERKAKEGNKGASLALYLLSHSTTMLSVTLIGTNLAVVTNTVTITLYCLNHFGPRGELFAFLATSPNILLFGEIIPKSIFQRHSDAIAPVSAWVIYYIRILFFPLIIILRLFSRGTGHLLGIQRDKAKALSREELKLLIEDEDNPDENEDIPALNQESIRESEKEIIGNILSLRDKTVEEVMIPLSEVISLSKESTLKELALEIKKHGITRIPVFNKRVDVIVGIVHSFDILSSKNLNMKAKSIMTPPIFVPENQKAFKLMVDLQNARKGMAVVVNEYGGAEGIATIEDVLEEIVGEIEDEFDKSPEYLRKIDNNTYLLSGRFTISQLNEELETKIDEDASFETIAGLILDNLQRMPRVGDKIEIESEAISMTVTKMNDRAILEVKLKRL